MEYNEKGQPILYCIPKSNGSFMYRDKECTQFFCHDPWTIYRKDMIRQYNNTDYDVRIANKTLNREI